MDVHVTYSESTQHKSYLALRELEHSCSCEIMKNSHMTGHVTSNLIKYGHIETGKDLWKKDLIAS